MQKNAEKQEDYFCIGCGQKIIPRLGDIRIHHFWHKNESHNCNKETYLHELGKKVFYETYKKCIEEKEPFYMTASLLNPITTKCVYNGLFKSKDCVNNDKTTFDLTTNYFKIELEKIQGNFKY